MQMKDIEKPRKWKWISQYLWKRGWNRSHVQCRNKWVNELAPGINHKAWTDCELKLLYTLYDQHNSHWSSIQKSLPGRYSLPLFRTQIRIKNHFYGVLRGITRLILKYFKEAPGSETKISNRINPNTLKNMYKGINCNIIVIQNSPFQATLFLLQSQRWDTDSINRSLLIFQKGIYRTSKS